MTIELNLTSDALIDFAVGTVIKGKEAQVFAEYFPLVAPVMQECGIETLRGFAVLASNSQGKVPEQGALTRIPSADHFARFYSDPRFIDAKPLRDEGMEFLSDGNFYKASDEVIALDEDADYALVIAKSNPLAAVPLMELPSAEEGSKQACSGKSLSLHPWSEQADELMKGQQANAEVFRIRFLPAG